MGFDKSLWAYSGVLGRFGAAIDSKLDKIGI